MLQVQNRLPFKSSFCAHPSVHQALESGPCARQHRFRLPPKTLRHRTDPHSLGHKILGRIFSSDLCNHPCHFADFLWHTPGQPSAIHTGFPPREGHHHIHKNGCRPCRRTYTTVVHSSRTAPAGSAGCMVLRTLCVEPAPAGRSHGLAPHHRPSS